MTAAREAGARAAAVSRALAKAGLRPLPSGTPRSREGIRVSRNPWGPTTVSIDIDLRSARENLGGRVSMALVQAGFEIKDVTADASARYLAYGVQRVTA